MQNNIILYTTRDKKIRVELYEFSDSVYLNQESLAKLFDTSKSSISEHITNILKDGELQEDSVVRIFRITASDNKQYNINFILEYEKNLEETYKALKER